MKQPEALDTRVLDSFSDCAMVLDVDGRVLYINTVGMALLEAVDQANVGNRSLAQFFDHAGCVAVLDAVTAAVGGAGSRFDLPSRTPAGNLKWWDVTINPVRAADGGVGQVLAVSRDITTRKRKNEFLALEQSMLEKITRGTSLDEVLEGLIRLIEQYSGDTRCCVLLLGDDGKTVQRTSAPNFSAEYAQAVHGLPVGPRVGSCGTAMFRRSRVIVEDIYSDPLWEGYDDIKRLSGGHACWSTPIFSDDDEVVGSFAIYALGVRQPTADEVQLMDSAAQFVRVAIDKHRTQQSLRRSEDRNRAMLFAIPDWVFLTTREGRFLDYHVRDLAALPTAPEEIEGAEVLKAIPDPFGTELAGAIERVGRMGEQEHIEGSLHVGREERHFEASIVRCDGDKVLSVVREVTEHKRMQIEAATRRAELAHLGRVAVLGEITGALAHELSQPLAIMRTNADVACRILDTDEVRVELLREVLDDIISSNRRAGDVINRLRALLRKDEPSLERVDLDDVVRSVAEIAQSEIMMRRVQVRISSSDAGSAIMGDQVQLQQVLLNLVLNACDALQSVPEQDRRLFMTTRRDGDSVELSVRDTGIGIAEEDLERVFQPFVSMGKDEHGMGLGLAISRSIVEAHHGSIRAEKNRGAGTTFSCCFPLADAASDSRAGDSTDRATQKATSRNEDDTHDRAG